MRHALVLIGFLSLSAAAVAQTGQPGVDGPAVVTLGEGIVKRAPDRAWLQITAESRARNPRDAQKTNSDVMSVVVQKLRGAGLAADALQTRGYDLQPEFDYNNGRQTLKGYVARNSLEVRVDELARLGEILDLAVTFGATTVGNVRFDLKDRDGAEREALRLAVQDARRRADAAAAGASMKVDRILRLEEQRAGPEPPRPMVAMSGMRTAESAGQPPIETGELEIRVSVRLVAVIR
jgi:uncharacterized protein